MPQVATGRRYIRRSQLIGPHALPHIRLRHLLCHRLYGELAAQPVFGGVETVDARAELRVLRLGRVGLLPAASRHDHHRLHRWCRGRAYATEKSRRRRYGVGLRRALGAAGVVQVLRLRLGQRRQPDACDGTRACRAAAAGGAPHRHLVLHVHGVELCDRHLPPPAPAGASLGPRALPVVLPPSARRARSCVATSCCPSCASDGTRRPSTTRVPCG